MTDLPLVSESAREVKQAFYHLSSLQTDFRRARVQLSANTAVVATERRGLLKFSQVHFKLRLCVCFLAGSAVAAV